MSLSDMCQKNITRTIHKCAYEIYLNIVHCSYWNALMHHIARTLFMTNWKPPPRFSQCGANGNFVEIREYIHKIIKVRANVLLENINTREMHNFVQGNGRGLSCLLQSFSCTLQSNHLRKRMGFMYYNGQSLLNL